MREAAVRSTPPAASGSQADAPPAPDADQALTGSTVLRMIVGARMRRLREDADVTPGRAAYAIRGSESKISRMENGRVRFKLRDLSDLLTLYGVTRDGPRQEVLALAQRGNAPAWWAGYGDVIPAWLEPYLDMEAAATVIRCFETRYVPGLFQTEAYAWAVTMPGSATPEQARQRVDMRLKRQEVLSRPAPPRMWAVIDEAALRRPAGGREVMIEQLKWLIEIAGLPHVTMQVLPFSHGCHAAGGSAFTLLRFGEPDVPDTVYIEHLTTAVYLSKRADAEHYLEVMNAISARALKPEGTRRFLRQIIRET